MEEETPRTAVFFDFDGTLVRGDSLFPFLRRVAGWKAFGRSFIRALFHALFRPHGTRRTFIKARLLHDLLAGRRVSDVQAAVHDLMGWVIWKKKIVASLLEHHMEGHRIVIVTGSLDLYMPTLLVNLHYDDLICTRMAVRDGLLTGEMDGGNCARENKAARVKAYLEKNGPFHDTWGYGNVPHDVPMMALLSHKVVV